MELFLNFGAFIAWSIQILIKQLGLDLAIWFAYFIGVL
jgi:hypothetical protein